MRIKKRNPTIDHMNNDVYKTRETGRLSNQLFECIIWILYALRDSKEFECTYDLPKIFNFKIPKTETKPILPRRPSRYPHHYNSYIKPNLEIVKSLFQVKSESNGFDLVLHLRLDDIKSASGFFMLSKEWYERLIPLLCESIKTVAIITFNETEYQEYFESIVSLFKESFENVLVFTNERPEDDFLKLLSAKYIIGSCSTFTVIPSILNTNLIKMYLPWFGDCPNVIKNVWNLNDHPDYIEFIF